MKGPGFGGLGLGLEGKGHVAKIWLHRVLAIVMP